MRKLVIILVISLVILSVAKKGKDKKGKKESVEEAKGLSKSEEKQCKKEEKKLKKCVKKNTYILNIEDFGFREELITELHDSKAYKKMIQSELDEDAVIEEYKSSAKFQDDLAEAVEEFLLGEEAEAFIEEEIAKFLDLEKDKIQAEFMEAMAQVNDSFSDSLSSLEDMMLHYLNVSIESDGAFQFAEEFSFFGLNDDEDWLEILSDYGSDPWPTLVPPDIYWLSEHDIQRDDTDSYNPFDQYAIGDRSRMRYSEEDDNEHDGSDIPFIQYGIGDRSRIRHDEPLAEDPNGISKMNNPGLMDFPTVPPVRVRPFWGLESFFMADTPAVTESGAVKSRIKDSDSDVAGELDSILDRVRDRNRDAIPETNYEDTVAESEDTANDVFVQDLDRDIVPAKERNPIVGPIRNSPLNNVAEEEPAQAELESLKESILGKYRNLFLGSTASPPPPTEMKPTDAIAETTTPKPDEEDLIAAVFFRG